MTDRPHFAKAVATAPLLEKLIRGVVERLVTDPFIRAAQDDPERATRVLRDAFGQLSAAMVDGGLSERPMPPDQLDALAREVVATLRGDLPLGQVQDSDNN